MILTHKSIKKACFVYIYMSQRRSVAEGNQPLLLARKPNTSPEGSVPPGRWKNCCLAVLNVLIPPCSPEDTLVYIVLVTKNSGLHETKTIRTTAAEKQKEFY